MHKFWYHSPVRFYHSVEELEDMTNPQNCQYFGSGNPYPLEISEYHRFLIPNIDNEILVDDLGLYIGKTQIPCEFGISNDKLYRITFICHEILSGRLEIRSDSLGTIYYSNCVIFNDSTDYEGRKFIRVATKHYYNRFLFAYDNSNFDYMVTNLPAYDFGQFTIDSEFNTQRTGEQNSLLIADSYVDEVVSYQFLGNGDSNIFTFITSHALNSEFYIDGTKRTIKEQPDIDEYSMQGIMKFVNQKDEKGLNVTINENDIFDDVFKYALGSKDKLSIYTYQNNENAIPTN